MVTPVESRRKASTMVAMAIDVAGYGAAEAIEAIARKSLSWWLADEDSLQSWSGARQPGTKPQSEILTERIHQN